MISATPFLMFTGRAREAMEFYVSLVPDSRIESVELFGEGGPGVPGTVMRGSFTLAGRDFMASDSPPVHDFGFTPSISVFLTCDTPEQVDSLVEGLSDGGAVLMPLDAYPFSSRFAWVQDRYGVSWQISVPLS